MSIPDMPKDELDKLFRQAAAGHQPEYDPAAWTAMEKKLDAHAGISATKWWQWSGLLALIFFVGLSTWWGYHNFNQEEAGNKQTTTQPIAESRNNVATRNKVEAGNKTATGNKTGTTESLKPASVPVPLKAESNASDKPTDATARNEKLARTNIALGGGERSLQNNATITKAKKKFAGTGRRSAITQVGQTSDKAVGSPPETNPAQINAASDKPAALTVTGSPVSAGKVNNQLPAVDSAAVQQVSPPVGLVPDSSRVVAAGKDLSSAIPDSAGTLKKRKALALNRFTFSLLAAPDLSTVGFANPGSISTNAGITLGYSLNNKWSLTTGIIKARKIYAAKPEDYGNKEYWYNRHQPDAIAAVCRVLDIPVNIGYKIRQKEKSVITLQTGLSSYLMLNEKYTYKYLPYGSGTGYTSYAEVKNKNRHLFNIYNLSGSYQRLLTPSVLVGIEPFVKVPLAGVGAGKIKLTSAGVFFSLSYRYQK
ncbi:MAG: hypothetical protein JWQ14_3080 [Adhaeribacter sp.]|nr:hypothetical protein [Adhaeribacter sp.]